MGVLMPFSWTRIMLDWGRVEMWRAIAVNTESGEVPRVGGI